MNIENIEDFNRNYSGQGITAITLEVSDAQATALKANLLSIAANPGYYSLLGNQCTSVACSALVNSKIDIEVIHLNHGDPGPSPITTTTGLTPTEFKDILLNGQNSIQDVTTYTGH